MFIDNSYIMSNYKAAIHMEHTPATDAGKI